MKVTGVVIGAIMLIVMGIAIFMVAQSLRRTPDVSALIEAEREKIAQAQADIARKTAEVDALYAQLEAANTERRKAAAEAAAETERLQREIADWRKRPPATNPTTQSLRVSKELEEAIKRAQANVEQLRAQASELEKEAEAVRATTQGKK